MLFVTRPSDNSPKEIENVITAKNHAIEQGNSRNHNLLLCGSVICLGPDELDLANFGDTPAIGSEFCHGHLLLIHTDKIPGLEPGIAGPCQCDWRFGIGEIE